MLITNLPAELLLHILSHLPVRDIHALQLASRIFNNIVRTNEGGIYHAAAIVHNFATSTTSLNEVTHSSTWLNGVTSWKEFCKKHFTLEARWHGKEVSPKDGLKIGRLLASGPLPRRFKVDEEEGTVVLSVTRVGIRVLSIETDEVLWELTDPQVDAYSNIALSGGFLEFAAPRHHHQVWRRSVNAWDPEKYIPCNPTPGQKSAVSFHAPTSPPSPEISNPGRRGTYVPFAVFQAPKPGSASRLVYPDFAIASSSAQKAYIWDIPSTRLIETIHIAPHASGNPTSTLDGHANRVPSISSIDISKDHLFVCWGEAVIVYSRHQSGDGTNYGCFSISNKTAIRPEGFPGSFTHDLPYFHVSPHWVESTDNNSPLLQTSVQSRQLIQAHSKNPIAALLSDPAFSTVHVSPDGKDLVAITSSSCLLVYVKDFQTSPENGYDSRGSFRVSLNGDRRICSTFDGRRIAIAIEYSIDAVEVPITALFVISINDDRHPSGRLDRSVPLDPTIIFLESFQRGMAHSSCIQITGTRVWTTWLQVEPDDHAELRVTYVDLASVDC